MARLMSADAIPDLQDKRDARQSAIASVLEMLGPLDFLQIDLPAAIARGLASALPLAKYSPQPAAQQRARER